MSHCMHAHPPTLSTDNPKATERWLTCTFTDMPNNGRLPSMGGMGMGLGLEGGAGAMGPQEAVQGRSLRSYEDLDAAGSKEVKGEDLDY